MPAKKNREPGRPPGAANKANENARNCTFSIRSSEGFNKVVDLLTVSHYKSKADVIHEAVMLLASRKLEDKSAKYWITKI